MMAVSTAAGVLTAPSMFASMNVILVDDQSQYSYGNGGEFRAVGDAGLDSIVTWSAYAPVTQGTVSSADLSSWGGGSLASSIGQRYFQTFCIEYSEEFSPGTSYPVDTGYNALYGHVGAAPGTPVTIGTAWLYSQFAAGTLSGYNYTYGSGRTTSANQLQQAIWYLQGEGGSFNGYVTLAEANVANAWAAANGAFGVYALNLGDPGRAQAQLVIDDPAPVPEPTTMLAGAMLLLPFGASAVRRLGRNRLGKS